MTITIIRKAAAVQSVAPTVTTVAGATFQCMLAESKIPTEADLRFPLYASFKLDGIRCTMHNGHAMSRTFIELPNKHIRKWAGKYAKLLHGLDGEMVVGLPTGEDVMYRSTSGVNSEDGEPDFSFYVFEDWVSELTAAERYHALKTKVARLHEAGAQNVYLIDQVRCENIPQLQTYYAQAEHLQYEGLIIKNPQGFYKFGRSTLKEGTLLKWKEFIHFEAIIEQVMQGSTNTNEDVRSNTGRAKRSSAKAGKVAIETVGAFRCKAVNGPYKGKTFKAARGPLTKPQLAQLWVDRETLPGQIITVKSQKVGSKDLPRFPGFSAFRPGFDFDPFVTL